jgi:hypothetical protein
VTNGSSALEIDALGDREAVELAAQAVEAQFNGAQPHPFAPAEDARAISPPVKVSTTATDP